MKKIRIAAAALAILVMAGCSKTYPAAGIVSDIHDDTVYVTDSAGFTWAFCPAEDWMIGDMAAMTMNDKGTPSILDDEIVDVRYTGYFD